MNEIEDIKTRLDLVELIGQYVNLKKAGTNYKAVCPFHQEKTPSLMVSPEKQIWKCFGCGRGGDHFQFVMEAEHLEFGDALKLLAQKAGVTLRPRTRAEHQTRDKKERLYQLNHLVSRLFERILAESAAGKVARDYLKKRALKEGTVKEFRLGYAPSGVNLRSILLKKGFLASEIDRAGSPDKFYDRLMFPIFDVLGNVVGFTGRTLTDREPKYLNSPETPIFNKGRILFGLNLAKAAIKEKNFVVLVEGQIDVLMLHQFGVKQAVASSGTAITAAQIEILSKYTPNFLLAFDNDPAGRETTKKVITLLLERDLNSKVVGLGEFKDPDELMAKQPAFWRQSAGAAEEGLDWWLTQEINDAGELRFIENKKRVVKAMLQPLAIVADPTRLDHYIQRLSLRIGTKPEHLYAALTKIRSVSPQSAETRSTPLTNEEQLLALAISEPSTLKGRLSQLDDISWQSEITQRVAEALRKQYNAKTLGKGRELLSKVKSSLDSETAGKLDYWQIWLDAQWPEMTPELADELFEEKLNQATTKRYEQRKEDLAFRIRQAQESGDFGKVKKLMSELNELTKKEGAKT